MLAVEKKNKETNPTPQNTTVDQLLYRIFLKALQQAQWQDMNSSVSWLILSTLQCSAAAQPVAVWGKLYYLENTCIQIAKSIL